MRFEILGSFVQNHTFLLYHKAKVCITPKHFALFNAFVLWLGNVWNMRQVQAHSPRSGIWTFPNFTRVISGPGFRPVSDRIRSEYPLLGGSSIWLTRSMDSSYLWIHSFTPWLGRVSNNHPATDTRTSFSPLPIRHNLCKQEKHRQLPWDANFQ